ncbi:iron complex transport system substrate-binding protein [Amycolatopsis arida]|uniref:Iron complex transport system substrate-binding protein n=1 Tax=Amycolatopsis arida TaxID=587909 RepID=A0A1I5QY87_9PSEU|nr:iron-siderophore ABC transporter substrate-binding protein [Amycolatopsis arida]TDX99003.1 iron complex transport system substrate-binding protein [Amycolatopsis arida]SFP51057.1 iron complex transport system substrate-binding protein [Amycolatopsis arida]
MSRSARPRPLRRAGFAATLVACLALTACGGGADEPAVDQGAADEGFPRTIQHAMGETTLEQRPRTVAALDSSYVDAALALETKVVAFTRFPAAGEDQLPEYLPAADKEFAKDARVIGELGSPDIEQLYDIRPDLIVSAKVRHEQIYDELSNVAPTVFSQTTGATWKDNIRLLGRALGKEELAERRIGEYEARAERVGDNIRAKLGRDATVSLVRFVEGEPTVRLYSSASYPGIVMADVGLQRPEGQPDSQDKISVNLSQENITQLDADHIFVSTYSDPRTDEGDPRAQFESNPLWQTLDGEVSNVDDTRWFTSVSLQGAYAMLDDLADRFGVDPAR